MDTIGANIKHLRNEKGLTQKELASALGVSYQMVQSWERGSRNPKRETLEKIASALGVSWLDLMPGDVLNANTVEAFAAKSKENDTLARDVAQHLPEETLNMVQRLTDAAKRAAYPEIQQISSIMQTMNETGRRVAVERVHELAQIPAYQAEPDTGKK